MKTLRVLVAAIVASMAMALTALVLAAHAPAGAGEPEASWLPALRKMDEAVARKDRSAAVFAFQSAFAAALGSRRWQGMADVGDAALRLSSVTTPPRSMVTKARELYLSALFRARAERSLDGVLRITESFADLGDRQVVGQCLAIANALAVSRNDAEGLARVRALAERLHERAMVADTAAGP